MLDTVAREIYSTIDCVVAPRSAQWVRFDSLVDFGVYSRRDLRVDSSHLGIDPSQLAIDRRHLASQLAIDRRHLVSDRLADRPSELVIQCPVISASRRSTTHAGRFHINDEILRADRITVRIENHQFRRVLARALGHLLIDGEAHLATGAHSARHRELHVISSGTIDTSHHAVNLRQFAPIIDREHDSA